MKPPCCVLLATCLLLPAAAAAQDSDSARKVRFGLGQRLRAFDAAWDSHTDAAARKQALPHLKRASFTFLTGQDTESARALDRARLALLSAAEPADAVLWAASCAARPAVRVVDTGPGRLTVTLKHLYLPKTGLPRDVRLRLLLRNRAGKQLARVLEGKVARVPLDAAFSLAGVPEGDHTLEVTLLQGKETLAVREQTVSVVAHFRKRLGKIVDEVAALPQDVKTTDVLTVRSLALLLRRHADGKTFETNYPAARLFREAESVLNALKLKTEYYTLEKPGQFWLTLAAKDGPAPVRVQVPAGLRPGKGVPLVIALHGAGGSENLFFDVYGNGALARRCAERGWLLAATRNGLAEGVLEELARLYPVDARRVFLVGHSLGAAQAVAAAGRHPAQFAAVAALGGGGSVRPSEALKGVAFFVGVGTEDFLLSGARALRDALKKAAVKRVAYKEYKDVEHLAIVPCALKDVFAFFEGRGR